jgi:hypothetical protein
MFRVLTSVVLVLIYLPLVVGQANVQRVQSGPWRPVSETSTPLSAARIALFDFMFQEPAFLHAGPELASILGEPVIETEYVVEAYVDGEYAIATMKFEIVDDTGTTIGPLAMARHTRSGRPRYVGIMNVPAHPFRIVLTGHRIDGQPFRREHAKLFRPVDRLPSPPERLGHSRPEWLALVERAVEEASPQLIAEVKTDLAAQAPGVIVVPRMQVSNVIYAPLFSALGRPIGVRIAYDATFSQTSQFNPALRIEAKYENDRWRGRTAMEVLDSSITPMPREAYPPYGPVILNYIRTSPLVAEANYTYEGRTLYHFTADLVPDFIVHNLDRSKACIYYQKYSSSSWSHWSHEPFQQILSNHAPTTYSVVAGTWTGVIENFYGEGTLHQSFVAEGAKDCGLQPTRRF